MSYVLDLTDARAKLERAVSHINALRQDIEEAGNGDPEAIPLRREYDAKEGAVIWRVERIIQIAPHWGLVAGDALFNLRSALDYLAWQLAIRFLDGAEPSDKAAPNIQFPIISRAADWPGHRFRRCMTNDDADVLKPLQPFNGSPSGKANVFALLSQLCNADKHRRLHVLFIGEQRGVIPAFEPAQFRDCVPRQGLASRTLLKDFFLSGGLTPAVGEEAMRVLIRPTGPYPDVDLNPTLSGKVSFDKGWPVVETLDAIGRGVAYALSLF